MLQCSRWLVLPVSPKAPKNPTCEWLKSKSIRPDWRLYQVAIKQQIEAALRLEPGVLALYSVADKDNPAHITVFEIYADVEAYRTHLETAHFKHYKSATQDMVKSLKLRETVPILLGVKGK